MQSPNITTLPQDIYKTIDEGITLTEDQKTELGVALSGAVLAGLGKREQESQTNTLRMSNFGTPCERKLWYTVNEPDKAEPLDGKTKFKFTYGHILESLVLFLAKLAGHKVEGQQERLEVNGVVGHRDAIVDGVLVDVKSSSSFGIKKFKEHGLEGDDPFGYLDQLNLYLAASRDDPRLLVKGEAAFIGVGKEMGDIVVDRYKKDDRDWDKLVENKKKMLAEEKPPKRRYMPEPDGASGNMKLPTPCSYCQFKHHCHPGLRGFFYSNGPRWLTHVMRTPDVPEISKREIKSRTRPAQKAGEEVKEIEDQASL